MGDAPFLLVVAHFAPHQNAVPDHADQGTLAGVSWRPDSFNEADVSDKPRHIRGLAPVDEDEMDATYQRQLESMLAVDRSVGALLDALEASGRDQDTVVIYASDNGYAFGEHRLDLKGYPYEESIGVPAAVRLPGVPGREVDALVSVSVDLPATILDLAGVDAPTAGRSLRPLLEGSEGDGRWQLLQGIRVKDGPDYAGVRSPTHSYVEYVTGEVELYDLQADPAQLDNRAGAPELAEVEAELAEWLAAEAPLLLLTRQAEVPAGEDFELQLEARGGTPPYTWTVDALPEGLELDSSGLLQGRLEAGAPVLLDTTVRDSSASPYDGRPQEHSAGVELVPAARGG